MNERLDELLSAERDGALDPGEAAELARLRGESEGVAEAARARAEELAAVDAQLRALAAAPVDDALLARNLEALRRRLASDGARPGWRRDFTRRRFAAGLAAALAAGLVWASVEAFRAGVEHAPGADREQSRVVRVDEIVDERLHESGGEIAPATSVELVESVERVDPEDLEVIEELELLEYLVARESSGGGA